MTEQSIGSYFGGYCVIHAPSVVPERRAWFESEFKRVGILNYTVIEGKSVSASDPRLPGYTDMRARNLLSLIDAILSAIDYAEAQEWKSVLIMEDDVIFRKNIDVLWREAETAINNEKWDVLNLYRWPEDLLLIENRRRAVEIVPMVDHINCHCVAVQRSYFKKFRSGMSDCIKKGYPADFIYGILTRKYDCRLFATTKNLAGQKSGFPSSLQIDHMKRLHFYSSFRVCHSKAEYAMIGAAFNLSRLLKKIFSRKNNCV